MKHAFLIIAHDEPQVLAHLLRSLDHPRSDIFPWELKKGSNWVSITEEFCRYLVAREDDILRTFRRTLCPDEIFLQTVLWNSLFRSRAIPSDELETSSLRKIDWQRGSPYVWRQQDADELKSSRALFARKFSASTWLPSEPL